MLNWNRQEQSLTQGQPQGSQVIARAVHIDEISTNVASQPAPSAAGAAPVDPYKLAQRVFELLRDDLRVERLRRGSRR